MRAVSSPRAGFTLMELILAMALGSIVLVALTNLLVPLSRAQLQTVRGQTVQLAAVSAESATERALRQATWLGSPSLPGIPSDRLEGCENARVETGERPAPIDPSRPMRWFAFCSRDGVVYDHGGEGCPPRYACGERPLGAFGGGSLASTGTATFTRPSAWATTVEVELSFASGDASTKLRTAAAFAGAAGANQ